MAVYPEKGGRLAHCRRRGRPALAGVSRPEPLRDVWMFRMWKLKAAAFRRAVAYCFFLASIASLMRVRSIDPIGRSSFSARERAEEAVSWSARNANTVPFGCFFM